MTREWYIQNRNWYRDHVNKIRRERYKSDLTYREKRKLSSKKPLKPKKQVTPEIIAERKQRKKSNTAKWRQENKEKIRQYRIIEYQSKKAIHANKYKKRRDNLVSNRSRKCAKCGEDYQFQLYGKRKFCSDSCLRKSENDRKMEFHKKKMEDIRYRISNSVKGTLSDSLTRRRIRGKNLFKTLGYSPDDLRARMESLFTKDNGFTWENYGKTWHIDHVIPQLRFDFESMDDQEFKDCWSLSNLAPLGARENISKGNRYIGQFDKNGQLCFIV